MNQDLRTPSRVYKIISSGPRQEFSEVWYLTADITLKCVVSG